MEDRARMMREARAPRKAQAPTCGGTTNRLSPKCVCGTSRSFCTSRRSVLTSGHFAQDIRGLLTSWSSLLASSSLIFMRASRSHSKLFFHPPSSDLDPLLDRYDPRLRTFPFPTRRPTLDEVMRCVREVVGLKVVRLSEAELKALEVPPPAPAVKQPKEPKPTVVEKAPAKPKMSPEEALNRDRWDRVIDMVQKGRVEALETFFGRRQDESGPSGADEWLKGRVPSGLPGPAGEFGGWSLLHVAAAADQPQVVDKLLVGHRLDPTLLTSTPAVEHDQSLDSSTTTASNGNGLGRTAYELAPSKPTRNIFRRATAAHPDWWDWLGAARVPSALTEEMEQAQGEKGKDRKARLKEKVKEREREKAKERAEQDAVAAAQEAAEQQRLAALSNGAAKHDANGPRRLGGGAAPIIRDRNRAEAAGLTDEQRQRLERERRARAAEARMGGRPA